jgi:hypothetical protein
MLQAIFGLIGVLIGSFITWFIELWRARRRDTDERRVAARLVIAELQSIENVRTANEPEFARQKEMALRQAAWHSQRSVLARELDLAGWEAVGSAYDALSEAPTSTPGERQVDAAYGEAMVALEPLAARRRYWHQRLRLAIRKASFCGS